MFQIQNRSLACLKEKAASLFHMESICAIDCAAIESLHLTATIVKHAKLLPLTRQKFAAIMIHYRMEPEIFAYA
jgi:hypothetical protein